MLSLSAHLNNRCSIAHIIWEIFDSELSNRSEGGDFTKVNKPLKGDTFALAKDRSQNKEVTYRLNEEVERHRVSDVCCQDFALVVIKIEVRTRESCDCERRKVGWRKKTPFLRLA